MRQEAVLAQVEVVFSAKMVEMDPIKPKSVSGKLPVSKPATPSKPSSATKAAETTPQDSLQLQGGTKSKSPAKAVETRPAPKRESEPRPPAKPVPENTYTNAPQAILHDPAVSEVPTEAKTLAEIAGQVSKPKPKEQKPVLPQPPLSKGRKGSLLRRLGRGFLNFLTSDPNNVFRHELDQINRLESSAAKLKTPEQFQAKTAEFKAALRAGASFDDIRNEAYAVARQAAIVSLGMRPYDCQIQGALAMDDGHIAEMRTGEGKTLTALMPLYLNALAGKGAHLVTVNDTLASRDAKEMAPAFNLLGLSVGTVLEDMKVDEKRAGYAADVTYTTDRALGFDYLRDRTAKNPAARVQREPFFALIDEVDEVLIDEARSPLIISGQGEGFQQDYQEFNQIVAGLEAGKDYYLDRKKHSAWLSETGLVRVENRLQKNALSRELESGASPQRSEAIRAELAEREKLEKLLTEEQAGFQALRDTKREKPGMIARWRGAEWNEETLEKAEASLQTSKENREKAVERLPAFNLFSDENSHRVRFLYASLKAHALFEAGDDYTVTDGKVEIVDQNKGRTSEGRRYNDGVHQAIEAKEGVAVNDDQRTIASITYPNMFKQYPRLSGMSGTAKTSEGEFIKLYDLDVQPIPTNKPVIREDQPDLVFRTLEEKYEALATDAAKDFFEGRPVLIGTLSVEHNEYLAKLLLSKGVPRESLQVLNADTVRGDKEGENEMIGQAGRSGVITVATNLAGRGANIKPDLINFKQLAEKTVASAGQGKPVSITVRKKSEAEWLNSWLGDQASVVPYNSTEAPGPGEVVIRYTKGVPEVEQQPEWSAETVMLDGADFPTGGLTVYGTERSTSRRIDDQLIGRSGRQGAPGRSRFYLSLEDDLLRIFAGSKLDAIMSHFVDPGKGVSSEILDKLIAEAQGSVEGDHFAAREATNKQDEVLNYQREAFFAMRDDLLDGGKPMRERLETMVFNAVNDAVFDKLPDKDRVKYGQIREALAQASQDLNLPLELPFLNNREPYSDDKRMSADDLAYELQDLVSRGTGKALRAMKALTGRAEEGVRPILLDVVDDTWSEHLEMMDRLRMGVQWQVLAEKDPEVEYKLQAYDLFGETVGYMNRTVASGLYRELLEMAEMIKSQPSKKPVA